LVDTKPIGQPISHQFLPNRRIIVLTMLGTGFLLCDKPERYIYAF